MADLSQKIKVEYENIENILNELPQFSTLYKLATLELAGVAALVHNFYKGVENILKQIFIEKKINLPSGQSWHKELLEEAVTQNIISVECKVALGQYLAFRHFFNHAYAFDLYPDKMESLVKNSSKTYSLFKKNISNYL